MDRIRRDDVEALARRREEMARVVEDDLHARIVEDGVVLGREEARRSGDARLDLADDYPLYLGMQRERADGHSGAEAYDQHVGRIGRRERGQVAEQALEAEIG